MLNVKEKTATEPILSVVNGNPNVWDFIGEFYPGYSSADEIAHSEDLRKILDGEDEEGSAARTLKRNLQAACISVQVEYDQLHRAIYERAIENFLARRGEGGFAVQKTDISDREFATDEEYAADDKDFHSKNWENLLVCDTPVDALVGLVEMINGDELDDVNNWFRVVSHHSEEVL